MGDMLNFLIPYDKTYLLTSHE